MQSNYTSKCIDRMRFNYTGFLKHVRNVFSRRPDFLSTKLLWYIRQICLPWLVLPVVVKHKNRAKFYLSSDPIDDKVLWGLYVKFHDLYFPPEIKTSLPDALFVDIGAHHGYYTIAALHQYSGIRIIAVEPDPINFQLLKRNLILNRSHDNVEVYQAALGKGNGPGWLTMSEEGSWGNYLGDLEENSIKVQVLSIINILGSRIPYLVKCNCEGGEFEIIPELFRLEIFPEYILLFVHPQKVNEGELLKIIDDASYEVTALFSSMDHPRYICRKINT